MTSGSNRDQQTRQLIQQYMAYLLNEVRSTKYPLYITLSQTTNFELFQTERVCRREY